MQASYKDNKKRLTLNFFNLVLGADSENGNLPLGFSKTIKEFET